MIYYDERGRALDLVGEGHRGGEGTVHRIGGDASRVAKVYHAGRLGPGVEKKLRVMLEQPPEDPSWKASRHRSIAWVDGLLFAEPSGRELRGFTMPSVDTTEFRQAHVYYDAVDRLRTYGGEFTWRHLMFAAHNLASAVAAVHAAGHRVGDLRETNLLVAPSSLVTLIDCDSFQICDPRTQEVHPTRVATGDYLPPELQGVDFRTQQPDRYHGDLFALAVLVFRFLMLGVHPFQAKGPAVLDAPTTEAKIRKGVFAFAGRRRGAGPPEYAPPYSILPGALRDLLEAAFVRGHSDPEARPEAAEWVAALAKEAHRLRTCRTNPNHWYAHGKRTCPWCAITPDPFPVRATIGRQIALDGAPSQVPEAARIEQVRAFARVALVDGPVTDGELAYLRKAGGELGLRAPVIDRVIDDEAKRFSASTQAISSTRPPSPPRAALRGRWRRVRDGLSIPALMHHRVGNRRSRSALKAAAPILVCCTLAGALAPAVVPACVAVIGVPALAALGDVAVGRGWRVRARIPLRFAIHLHRALGHVARLFVPLGILAAAIALAGVRTDWVARGSGAAAAGALAWLVIARLPFSSDASASALRAGRDAAWRTLVGDSGRTRRPAYVLWVGSVGAAAALSANYALWWPLPIP